jgi:hypothetical protein
MDRCTLQPQIRPMWQLLARLLNVSVRALMQSKGDAGISRKRPCGDSLGGKYRLRGK